MNQKGLTLTEFLIVIAIVCMVAAVVGGFLYGPVRETKIERFELTFKIDLRPHLSSFKTIDPKVKEIIQKDVIKQLTELWEEYYEVWSEREKIRMKSPDEFGGIIKQLEELKELNNVIMVKWSFYMKAKESAEWWEISFDLPEVPGH